MLFVPVFYVMFLFAFCGAMPFYMAVRHCSDGLCHNVRYSSGGDRVGGKALPAFVLTLQRYGDMKCGKVNKTSVFVTKLQNVTSDR